MLASSINYISKADLKANINTDAYTGERLEPSEKTIEHINARSKNHNDAVSNFLVVGEHNEIRGDIPFEEWIEINRKPAEFKKALKKYPLLKKYDFKPIVNIVENIQKYIDRYRWLDISRDSQKIYYGFAVRDKLNKMVKKLSDVHFKGNNNFSKSA